jgi:hypothetical protein
MLELLYSGPLVLISQYQNRVEETKTALRRFDMLRADMLRAFGAFLVVFSVLSLMVHLDGLGGIFGIGAVAIFAIEGWVGRFAQSSPSSTLPRERLL